jgi:dihydroorotate dehydrogenase
MTDIEAAAPRTRVGNEPWFWVMLMGLSMLVGGLMAMAVATTRVVLPYDESMAGLTREQLLEVNDRLLLFMAHDRVTLAGTMLAVGILYSTMAWWGIRRGVHWAHVSVIVSALAGFFSFFSFLSFGYFDPFHAFVTAILFQFLLLTIHARLPQRHRVETPDLWNDWRWKANQWGQLLFVIHGAVLITAGVVISIVGMTTVFVPEDLEFMRTTAADLVEAHPQLVPLVAHDRATFGGMLIACGVATMLPALWGFRRGQAWLWWALMLAGNIAYVSTFLVHWGVGYHSLKHLLPVYGGLGGLWAGGIASYWFLVARDRRLELEWTHRLSRT